MSRQYYLSKFQGDGTSTNPYTPVVAEYGRCGRLDYRKDQTLKRGWCIACLESDKQPPALNRFALLADLDYVSLGSDVDRPLDDETIDRLRVAIELPFKGRTLREIIAETQLCCSDIIPNGDGVYQIILGDEIWSGTEEEAFDLVASCLCPYPVEYDDGKKQSSLQVVQSSTQTAIELLKQFFDYEAKAHERLDAQLRRGSAAKNPVVAAIHRVKLLIETNDPSLLTSTDVTWLTRFAHDLGEIESLILSKQMASRLRDADAVDSLKFEVMVIAAYRRNGAQVQMTDESVEKSPECNVSWNGASPVHVECKMKSAKAVKRRDAQARFERLADETFNLLDQAKRFCDVRIESRFDPSDEDITDVLAALGEMLASDCNLPTVVRKGSRSIGLYAEPIVQIGERRALATPAGFDFARSEARSDHSIGGLKEGRSIAWKTGQRWRWIKSAIQTVKNTRQLPTDEPSILYLAVAPGPIDVVWLRTQVLAEEVRKLLEHDCRRLSMIVIVGEGNRIRKGSNGAADVSVATTLFQVVENVQSRNPLPSHFKAFGRDFTR